MRFPWEDEAEAEAEAETPVNAETPAEAEAPPEPRNAVQAEAPLGDSVVEPGAASAAAPPAADREAGTAPSAERTPAAPPAADREAGTAPSAERTPAAAPAADRVAAAEPGAAAPRQRPLVRKEYYSISEVSDLVGLPAHVLRYWESQFAVLSPSKNRSGNRFYQRKEIRLILLVKQLLHDEKYTVEGAKQKLEQLRRGGTVGDASGQALDAQMVGVLREELLALNELLQVDAS
jgi:DNA-binding transcriptional MerR regulator